MGFHFTARVKKVRKNYKGGKSGAQLESHVYLLIPEQSTQADLFLDMWKPNDKHKKPETPVTLRSPASCKGLVQVCYPDEHSGQKYYLHVMSPSMEGTLDQ